MNSSKHIQSELLSKLQNLSLKAKYVVEGFMLGLHKSPYHGFSVEFSEHRPYGYGDEVRHVDWKLWCKTNKYYIKQFEEETNLKAHIILDQSKSMDFSSNSLTKFEYAKLLSASISYLLIKQQDAVGLTLFDEQINYLIPAKSLPSHLNVLLSYMESANPGTKTNIASALHSSADRISKRGLIIIVSDFMDNINNIISGLKHLRYKGHEIIVFHLLDPQEKNFDFTQRVKFIDKETKEEIITDPWHIANDYKSIINNHCNQIKKGCELNKIDYFQLNTDNPIENALSELLLKRKNY